MQLGALRVFCDVARHRSFSQAAHANDITQSAVSQIVSHLEREMNVQLVDRSTRPLHLTPLGQTFYEGCQSLLDQYQELEAKISKAQAEIAGSVQVAAIYSVGMSDMGQYVKRFAELQPNAQVHLEYLHPDRVYQKVEEGTADMGLVSFPSKNGKLSIVPWREEAMVVVCPRNHPLARQASVALSELNGRKFVHFDRNLVIRRKIDRFFREHGVAVEVVHEFDNIENIKQAVTIGSGIAFLPEPTVQREVKQKSMVALPTLQFKMVRPLGILLKRGHWLSAAAKTFLELLQGQNGKLKNGKH
jgi:DNA-binding transcriptional LysR family regulator